MGYTELSQLPAKEAAIWDAAHVGNDGKQRQVTRQFAGVNSSGEFTVELFLKEATDRLACWRDGRYELFQAAQVVADSNPAVDAKTFCTQMEDAAYAGALTLRQNGVPLKADTLQRGSVWHKAVRQTDVNKWLHDIDAGFELTYPYAEPQAEPDAPKVKVPASETKEQRQGRRLQACIDAGLPMNDKAALSRLPDGVGDVADIERVSRQAFSTDVKAALTRRETATREGGTVHRA